MGANSKIVARGWECFMQGSWDALAADYHDDMKFIMPGQDDVLDGKANFRAALDRASELVPPGFEVLELDYYENDAQDVITLFRWRCDRIPQGTWSSALFRLRDSKIYEERWFVDTVQWQAAF